jgi:uncharacterized phiE125 gp8 family phage protein
MQIKQYTLLTPAISPALELDDVKDRLRISDNDSDNILISLMSVVTSEIEGITGRDFINKTYKGYLDYFPNSCESIKIRKSKLQSITSIQYLLDGVLTVWDSSNYYMTDTSNYSTINLVDGSAYPEADDRKQSIIVTFVAGYGEDSCDVPAQLRQSILSQIAFLYENAGDCVSAGNKQAKSLYFSYIIAEKMILVI